MHVLGAYLPKLIYTGSMRYDFPEDFIWGTATSAHQVEGNNTNSDWWRYEQTKETEGRVFPIEPSLEACDSYNRYEEDFDLCKQMNNNGVRISIEWARIEPAEGEFSSEEIEHYRKVLQTAKDKGLKTFVTLHHFTSPIWLADKGGWHNPKTASLFARYSKRVAEELDSLIDAYMTINEPQVYSYLGYRGAYDWQREAIARWVPAKQNYVLALINQLTFMYSHVRAYKAIKKVNKDALIGIVKNISWFETDPYDTRVLDVLATKFLNFLGRDFILRPIKRYLDFIGLNYYFTNRIKNFKNANPNDYVSDLGWWINPGGLQKILEYLKVYNVPIYITENGLADATDRYRKRFIRDHLISTALAIKNGAKVKGYFHWSLIDNYEWHHGYSPRFGLIEIERDNNLTRRPRPSFYYYAEICKNKFVTDRQPENHGNPIKTPPHDLLAV